MIKNWSDFLRNNSKLPETVNEAVDRLIVVLDGEQKIAIAVMQQEDLINIHFGLGMAIWNTFGLHDANSKLVASINNTMHPGALYNSVHPDDASEVIIQALLHRLITL